MITVVDYGIGNLGSIRNMLKRVGAPVCVTADPDEIAAAKKILFTNILLTAA